MVLLPVRTPRGRGRPGRRSAVAVAVTVLALVLTACGGSPADPADPADQAGSGGPSDANTAATPSPSAAPTSDPPAAEDGTDTDACFDGRCEVALSAPTDIRLDGELGVGQVSVTEITEDGVTVSCTWGSEWQDGDRSGGSSGAQAAIMAKGNVLPCRNLRLRLADLADGTVVLELSPM